MIILGIDPGSIRTGYAYLESMGNRIRYLASGTVDCGRGECHLQRIKTLSEGLNALLTKISPDEMAIESLIYGKNPSSLIKLAQARGAILSQLLKTHQGKIFEYSPNMIKSSTTGYGHATKDGIKKCLDMLLGHREYRYHDESDACAIAICHIVNRKNRFRK